MRIVFWGTPQYAADNLLSLIKAGHNIIAVVTQPDRKRGRGKNLSSSPVKQVAIDFGIPVHSTSSICKDENIKKLLLNLNPDVYIVVAFGQILPNDVLSQPKLGCWNSHASLLPTWRGAAPIQWSILNDDAITGVCIMSMEEGLDTGPVIEKESTDINDSDNLQTLTNRLSKISSKLLLNALDRISDTKGLDKNDRLKLLKASNQSSLIGNLSYARQITKEDYIIDWKQESRMIFKKIQGLYPNAYTFHNKKRIKIQEISIMNKDDLLLEIDNPNLYLYNTPGTIIIIRKEFGILLMTNDNPILINTGQLEGKKITDGYTLAHQSGLKVNDILG